MCCSSEGENILAVRIKEYYKITPHSKIHRRDLLGNILAWVRSSKDLSGRQAYIGLHEGFSGVEISRVGIGRILNSVSGRFSGSGIGGFCFVLFCFLVQGLVGLGDFQICK